MDLFKVGVDLSFTLSYRILISNLMRLI